MPTCINGFRRRVTNLDFVGETLQSVSRQFIAHLAHDLLHGIEFLGEKTPVSPTSAAPAIEAWSMNAPESRTNAVNLLSLIPHNRD